MTEKRSAPDLAICGGPVAFGEPVHVGRPNLPDRAAFVDRMAGIWDRHWLTNDGPLLHEFEARVAEAAGVRHCVAMSSGTMALEVVTRALELSGEVILPSFTFVATAHALFREGVTPVFCDVDRRLHNIDPAAVESLITPRTTAIVGVHLWGNPCDAGPLAEIAARHGLRLLFDASHAFGCTHGGRLIGGFGEAEVFSFHATKFVNTAEGGAVVTNSDALAERLRLIRNFGFAGYDRVVCFGTNGKMSELHAAMGLATLDDMPTFLEANRRNAECYGRGLEGLPGVTLLRQDAGEQHNRQYVIAEIDPHGCPLNRDELIAVLHAENVLARRYFHPGCHRMEPYRTLFPESSRRLPNTEEICDRVLVLPTGTGVTESGISTISSVIRCALASPQQVRSALRDHSQADPPDA